MTDQTTRTDGGTDQKYRASAPPGEFSDGHGIYWREQALKNVEEWGLQSVEVLLLAAIEELGELARAHLEARYEGESVVDIYAEIDDLAPLCYQLMWAVEAEYEGGGHA